ncbi:CDP-glycerol glycerophosphotransferase family protein [Staphylococcus simulans]|uniref:CDP-glycerol glycerophosphotransferase family protein n=1 Tax=Staphylococcus simulans TaxID=1286 RepID=UPI003F7D142C
MKVNILGFNLFAKGGTTRSNINLIKAFQQAGHDVTYFNYLHYEDEAIMKLVIHENINPKRLEIKSHKETKALSDADILILTRESLFKIARDVKKHNKNIKIIGEVHGPLWYLDDDADLALDAIDAVRVSTKEIQEAFSNRFHYSSVFHYYVNAAHIQINEHPINTKRNLFIKSRFEDGIKDISYVIKLMDYIVNIKQDKTIQLYIQGYGPSEVLYQNLIHYYNLEDNVHLNQKVPQTYIYVSSSPYETLGYSILEAMATGNQALIYPGDDNVLQAIYEKYHNVHFMKKEVEHDYSILKSMLEHKYTNAERLEDVNAMKADFQPETYAEDYLTLFNKAMSNRSLLPIKLERKIKGFNTNGLKFLNKRKNVYKKMMNLPGFRKVSSKSIVRKGMKKIYNVQKNGMIERNLDKIKPKSDRVFIESFHGSNFSGDPKYIALAIQNQFNDKKIFVSSRNALVDIEIRNHGFIPVRFGSLKYMKTFRSCKYVFMNGNSWDRVDKDKRQVFVQTWHGFPLKKMVNNLNDEQERKAQFHAFKPRMKKWDYLLTSSKTNKMLLESAFDLEKNKKLKVLQLGAPRNEYLIKNNNEAERTRIRKKYLQVDAKDKKFVLYCPTWRKDKRSCITGVDLKALLDHLPSDYEIIVKLHPNDSNLRTKYNQLDPRIHCFFNEFVDIQELYLISDVMITDYSSTIFDYAHLNLPILLLQEDSQKYQDEIGFYFDIHEVGDFLTASQNEALLAKQITHISRIDYSNLINRLMNEDDWNTSFNILQTIFKDDSKRKYNINHES